MKFLMAFLLLTATFTSCDKSEVNKAKQETFPVTDAVKTGDWMVIYSENSATVDVGLTFLKFSNTGSLVATKDGVPFNGTWTETNTGGNNVLTINITTTDTKLLKANRIWKVTGVTEYFIDLKDSNAAGNATAQLMKH